MPEAAKHRSLIRLSLTITPISNHYSWERMAFRYRPIEDVLSRDWAADVAQLHVVLHIE